MAGVRLGRLGRGREGVTTPIAAFASSAPPPTGYSSRPDIPTFHDTPLRPSPPLPFFKLDDETLGKIEERLRALPQALSGPLPPDGKFKKEAGVLVPLCTVDGKPSVLLTVRTTKLRKHTGEIALPGGIRDPEDATIADTALRETFEEVHIKDYRIRLLGSMAPVPDVTGRTRVTPSIGYVELPSHPSELHFSTDEVLRVFHLTFEQLLDPARQKMMGFRNTKVRISVFRADDVTSVPPPPIPLLPAPTSYNTLPDEYQRMLEDYELEHGSTVVWGLTAYVLSELVGKVVRPVVEEMREKYYGR